MWRQPGQVVCTQQIIIYLPPEPEHSFESACSSQNGIDKWDGKSRTNAFKSLSTLYILLSGQNMLVSNEESRVKIY